MREIREGVVKWGTADDIIELTPGRNLEIDFNSLVKLTSRTLPQLQSDLSNPLPFTVEFM